MSGRETIARLKEAGSTTPHGIKASTGIALLAASVVLTVPAAFAQLNTATLQGVTKDASGALIPGSSVTVSTLR